MIPYEELAAALERRATGASGQHAAVSNAQHEDNTLSGNEPSDGEHYEVGEVLSDEEAS
jgi:hypothetical protein